MLKLLGGAILVVGLFLWNRVPLSTTQYQAYEWMDGILCIVVLTGFMYQAACAWRNMRKESLHENR